MKLIKNGLWIFLAVALLTGCNSNPKVSEEVWTELSGKLIVFHAGSLSVPFKEIADAFKDVYPGVEIEMESAGSSQSARKITDLNRKCDVMASADYAVIDDLLVPKYAKWNIKFASNEMCIVYDSNSRMADRINGDNWFEILFNDSISYGRSDPNSDPCGYRAVLTCKLAERFYENEGLAEKILAKDNNFIRPKETDLLALLETKTIDYIFLYRSVAEQHQLKYVILPDKINLKKPEFSDYYAGATCEVSGKAPGEVEVKIGEPMVYGVTICENAPNKELAIKFVEFLLDKEKGMAIMEKYGQPSLIPSTSETFSFIPETLKKFATK